MNAPPHILVAFGTRPEAIKLAPLILALREAGAWVTTCAIAQHRELLDSALRSFGVSPDLDLDVMVPDQDLDALTARILGRMSEVLRATEPDILVVQGDTTSAMASALAAYHAEIPVAHVEAGLRSANLSDPWPEEANRRVISRLAELHFAPTESARRNLLGENVDPSTVFVTGNTGIDAARLTSLIDPGLGAEAILVTCHRRENQRDQFVGAATFLRSVTTAMPERDFVLPLHPSPRLRALTERLTGLPNLHIMPPFEYPEMLGAIRGSAAVLTDSGGVQEECAYLGTPCLVTRAQTDRPESLASGAACVVGFDARLAISKLREAKRHRPSSVFGDGHAAGQIAQMLGRFPRRLDRSR